MSQKENGNRITSGESFTTAEEVMTLGLFPDWSLLFLLAQVVTANIKTRSVKDQNTLPCKSVPRQPQMQTALLLNYPEQQWCIERFYTMTWKQSTLTGKLNLCETMVCRWNTRLFWLGNWSSKSEFTTPSNPLHISFSLRHHRLSTLSLLQLLLSMFFTIPCNLQVYSLNSLLIL